MKEIIYHATATVARRVTFAAEQGITQNNVLGVIDKTTGKVIYTPLKFGQLSMSQAANPNPDGTKNYTLYFDNAVFPPVGIGDSLFIKIYTDDAAGGYDEMVAQFFGLPEALPEIEVATEQEVKDINDDVWGALYGYGMVAVTIHSLMRIGTAHNSENAQDSENEQNSQSSQNSENAQSTGYVTQDLASVIYVDPEKTWAENGFPTLYDDEGTAIDTTTNPAAGDEVFNYQIQES